MHDLGSAAGVWQFQKGRLVVSMPQSDDLFSIQPQLRACDPSPCTSHALKVPLALMIVM